MTITYCTLAYRQYNVLGFSQVIPQINTYVNHYRLRVDTEENAISTARNNGLSAL